MENTFGPSAITAREQTAARNRRLWKARLRMFVLWALVIAPMVWGILRAFDGVPYFNPQG